ncbi:MAG: hypothetical protein WCQ50_05295 [Spirochaetota bacterium]
MIGDVSSQSAARAVLFLGNTLPVRASPLALALLLVLPFGLAANGKDAAMTTAVGAYSADLEFGDKGAVVGDNRILVTLHDSMGMPVAGAKIVMSVEMVQDPSAAMSMDMGEKPKPAVLAADPASPGSYLGSSSFDSTGNWKANLEFAFTPGGPVEKASFGFEVVEAGSNWVILVVFGVLMVVTITAAAALRARQGTIVKGAAA